MSDINPYDLSEIHKNAPSKRVPLNRYIRGNRDKGRTCKHGVDLTLDCVVCDRIAENPSVERLKKALRNLLVAADLVAFSDCPFTDDCEKYADAVSEAEAVLKEGGE